MPGHAELVILPASMREVPGQKVNCRRHRKNRITKGIREVPIEPGQKRTGT
jgi:hypothetical protein